MIEKKKDEDENCGNIVGISTPNEFLMAVSPESIQVQDLVAVDTEIKTGKKKEKKKVWAKIMSIERMNPLFPRESAQEIAYEKIDALDTIVSISREMITARCTILGIERGDGTFDILGYPMKPTSLVYKPKVEDVQKIILGDLSEKRAIKVGHLKSREDVEVALNGHFIVNRHLAILAMTGAGKTVTCRKILEELIDKNYPMLIFDPHEDYINLKDYGHNVEIYIPSLDLEQEDDSQIIRYLEDFSGNKLSPAQERVVFEFIKILKDSDKRSKLQNLLNSNLGRKQTLKLKSYWNIVSLCGLLTDYKDLAGGNAKEWKENYKKLLADISGTVAEALNNKTTFYGIKGLSAKAAKEIQKMEKMSKSRISFGRDLPPPNRINELIQVGKTSIICFSGYTVNIRQSFASSILSQLLDLRVDNQIPRFLIVLEEAQNFVPSSIEGIEVKSSVSVIKQIATEGRKFGIGLILISQRPSRVNPTVLSQCNSYIIMRIINPSDQSYIRATIETLGKEEIALLPSLGTGEAIISGQCVNFPILTKIEQAKTEGVYEERDAFEDLLNWSPGQSNHPQKQSISKRSNYNKNNPAHQKKLEVLSMEFTEIFSINDFIISENNIKAAEKIYDDAIDLKVLSLESIECNIMGTQNYKINIDFNKNTLIHDCPDFINNKISKKKFCKHLIKLFKYLENQENFGVDCVQYLLNIIGNNLSNWSFKRA